MYDRKTGMCIRRASRTMARFAAVLASAAVLAAPARAQETGAAAGRVTLTDDGAPVHGAAVVVIGAGAVGLTDEQGEFAIDDVPAGSYQVVAQREHLTAGRQAITVVGGETATVDFALALSPVSEELTVTASDGGVETTFEAFNAVTTLDSLDIAAQGANNIGEVLRNEPGIAVRSFGPGAARPVIRGFDADRVIILEDGVRNGDLSATSGDHGVTQDPNFFERIEVVRGPATLLYGSNAVGGVVNMITPHESTRDSLFQGLRGQFGVDTGSANRQAGTSASVQHAQGGLLFWGGGSLRRTGDYDTPEGPVENSASELRNTRAGVGWFGDRAFASGGFTMEDFRYGVPFAGEFHSHGGHGHEGEDDHDGELHVDLDGRRRAGRFDVGLRNLSNPVIEGFRLSANVIDWRHDELEVGGGLERVGTTFANQTTILRAEVNQRRTARMSGRFGAWTKLRNFEAFGAEALVPETDHTAFAAFAYEEIDFGRYRLQFGSRVERNDYQTGERPEGHGHDDHDDDHDDHDDDHDDHDDGDDHDDHDDGDDHDDDHHDDDHGDDHDDHDDHGELVAPDPRNRQFLGVSASVGMHAELGAGSAFVANVTSSHRAPGLEELYAFGPHAGTRAFDVGDSDLDAETTVGLDLSLRHRSERVRGNLNFYVYEIDNFIFGDRTDAFADGLAVLDFKQGDSRFVGWDARGSVRLADRAWTTLGVGRVDARLKANDEPLPRIPPLRATLSLDVPWRGLTVSPELEFAAAQDRLFHGETETAGYSVVNLRASYIWPLTSAAHVLSFTGYNLTNALYRNHASFIKELAPEMGRGVKVGYTVRFF